MSRIHIAVTTRDIDRAIPFYETLFGVAPSKRRDDYAKFEVADPSVNFTLNRTTDPAPLGHRGAQHFGIQVDRTEVVQGAAARLAAAGLHTEIEEGVTCCYAVQDKVWAVDPDGHRWEIFVTHADAPVHSSKPVVAAAAPCCEPTCCQ